MKDLIMESLVDKKYTWLIIGVAGFIGSHLLQKLLLLNQKVVGIDNFYSGKKGNIGEVLSTVSSEQKNNFTFYDYDIRYFDDCSRVMKDVDYVLHQAAVVSVVDSINNPVFTNDVNVNGFMNILWAAEKQNVKRLVYASSSAVYGDTQTLPNIESDTGELLSPYAVSKYTNELYAKVCARNSNLEMMGLRYFNVFGPRQDLSSMYSGVIPIWLDALLNDKEVYINGDGETSRDFCYVEDVVQANILSAVVSNQEAINQVYNIGTGRKVNLNQLFNIMCDNVGKKVEPIYRDFRSGDIRQSFPNISKARRLLGYEPSWNLDDGLKVVMDWYGRQGG